MGICLDGQESLIKISDLICWGNRIVYVEDTPYIFAPLTLHERIISEAIHDKAIKEAQDRGLKTKAALLVEAKNMGYWSDDREKYLESLIEEQKEIEEEIAICAQKTKMKKMNDKLTCVKSFIIPLADARHRLLEAPNIENFAASERIKYMVFCAARSFPHMHRLWNNINDFEQETNISLVVELIRVYCSNINSIYADKDIRSIARSGFWRVKWLAAKNSGGITTLFSSGLSSLTNDQFRLLYWSQLYDSIFESPERPPDDIVNDDQKLDKWLEEKSKELDKRRQENLGNAKARKLNKRASNANEIGYTVDGFYSDRCTCGKPRGYHEKTCLYGVYLYYNRTERDKKIQEIQATNPEEIRHLLAREKAQIERKGQIAEQDLRRDPKTRAMLGMSTRTFNAKQ